jgi:hypothetical protein
MKCLPVSFALREGLTACADEAETSITGFSYWFDQYWANSTMLIVEGGVSHFGSAGATLLAI